MISAVIFDMDGVLIDSEPYWRQAEKEIFAKVDIELTDAMCASTMGFRIDEVVNHWHNKFPWDTIAKKELEEMIIDRLIELVKSEANAMPGVYASLEMIRKKGIPMALASSSSTKIINAVLKKLKIRTYFDVIRSAENEKYGKPHPAIFLNTASDLEVDPTNCLVIEDSFNGLIAAMSAKMKTIVIPDDVHGDLSRFDIADLRLRALSELTEESLMQFGIQDN